MNMDYEGAAEIERAWREGACSMSRVVVFCFLVMSFAGVARAVVLWPPEAAAAESSASASSEDVAAWADSVRTDREAALYESYSTLVAADIVDMSEVFSRSGLDALDSTEWLDGTSYWAGHWSGQDVIYYGKLEKLKDGDWQDVGYGICVWEYDPAPPADCRGTLLSVQAWASSTPYHLGIRGDQNNDWVHADRIYPAKAWPPGSNPDFDCR